jgi:hypothetical protein
MLIDGNFHPFVTEPATHVPTVARRLQAPPVTRLGGLPVSRFAGYAPSAVRGRHSLFRSLFADDPTSDL